MPKMGESIMEGTILKWLKKVGDRIERDERKQSANRSEATGYYVGKIITGYVTGYCIGVLLGIWFVYHFIVAPILFPLWDAIVKGLH